LGAIPPCCPSVSVRGRSGSICGGVVGIGSLVCDESAAAKVAPAAANHQTKRRWPLHFLIFSPIPLIRIYS
jgi:hypothetical protein